MQDNLACKNNYFMFFSVFFYASFARKRIHTNIRVLPRLHYTGTKGRPEWVFRFGTENPDKLIQK